MIEPKKSSSIALRAPELFFISLSIWNIGDTHPQGQNKKALTETDIHIEEFEGERAWWGNEKDGFKTRVRQAQHRAALSANAAMILMYWEIGHAS